MPLTYGKGGELKRVNIKLRVFDPGRLLVVRVGNLNEYESENIRKLYSWEPFVLFIEYGVPR